MCLPGHSGLVYFANGAMFLLSLGLVIALSALPGLLLLRGVGTNWRCFARRIWIVCPAWTLLSPLLALVPTDYRVNPPLCGIAALPRDAQVLSCYATRTHNSTVREPFHLRSDQVHHAWLERRGLGRMLGQDLGPRREELEQLATDVMGWVAVVAFSQNDREEAIVVASWHDGDDPHVRALKACWVKGRREVYCKDRDVIPTDSFVSCVQVQRFVWNGSWIASLCFSAAVAICRLIGKMRNPVAALPIAVPAWMVGSITFLQAAMLGLIWVMTFLYRLPEFLSGPSDRWQAFWFALLGVGSALLIPIAYVFYRLARRREMDWRRSRGPAALPGAGTKPVENA